MYDKGMTAQGYRYQGIAKSQCSWHKHEITRFKSSEEEGKLKDKKPVVFKASSSK